VICWRDQGPTTVDSRVTSSIMGQIKDQAGLIRSRRLRPEVSQITISESRHQRDRTTNREI